MLCTDKRDSCSAKSPTKRACGSNYIQRPLTAARLAQNARMLPLSRRLDRVPTALNCAGYRRNHSTKNKRRRVSLKDV